jgi:fatty acid desaturase
VLIGPGRWLPIFLLSQLIAGVYMASVFAPNHKGMPLIRGRRPSFLEQQVITSRNVHGGPLVDIMFGGLNYQIEHHLFPTIARDRLPELRQIVRPFCQDLGLPYEEMGVIPSYRLLLQQLEAIGREMDVPPPASLLETAASKS